MKTTHLLIYPTIIGILFNTAALAAQLSKFDAIINWGNGKVYFFKDHLYTRYDIWKDQIDTEYPAKIAETWPGIWKEGIDAAISWGNGKTYFFKGDQYIRFDIEADKIDPSYPTTIKNNWPGLWEADIDAAINWGDGKAYFFKGNQYIRYDIKTEQTDPGYPATIKDNWPGLWEEGIDAAINWGNGKTYFFKGNQYIRFDVKANQADAGYPMTISHHWTSIYSDIPTHFSLWVTNWDRLYLIQTDSHIKGYYIYYQEGQPNQPIEGQIEGVLTDNLLKGWWKQSNEQSNCGPNNQWSGQIALVFAQTGQSFTGDRGKCPQPFEQLNPNKSTWHGNLLQGQFQSKQIAPTQHTPREEKSTDIKETVDMKETVVIPPPENIIGIWRYREELTTNENYKIFGADFNFNSDGTIIAQFEKIDLADHIEKIKLSGTWHIRSDGTIIIDFNDRQFIGTLTGHTLAFNIEEQIRKFYPITNDRDNPGTITPKEKASDNQSPATPSQSLQGIWKYQETLENGDTVNADINFSSDGYFIFQAYKNNSLVTDVTGTWTIKPNNQITFRIHGEDFTFQLLENTFELEMGGKLRKFRKP
jgi:hypothetical protein